MTVKLSKLRNMTAILKSDKLVEMIDEIDGQILASAQTDPDKEYVATLDAHTYFEKDRVVGQVGAAPVLGVIVEARRGTLARALGSAGG